MAKDSCESSDDLSVFWLRRHGYCHGIRSGGIQWLSGWGHKSSICFTIDTVKPTPYIRLNYTWLGGIGKKEDLSYRVELTTTPCYFGGKRFWFICPLVVGGVPCRRRVGVIYLAGKYFGCRRCHNLAYSSQQENHGGRVGGFLKILALLERIGEEEKIRVRFWKNRPTKRSERLQRVIKGLGNPP